MPTLDVTGRCDLGFNTVAFNDAGVMAHMHHDEHMDMDMDDHMDMSMDDDESVSAMDADMANPSGRVDFTLEDWAATFTDQDLGMTVDQVVDAVGADDIYRRHVLAGVLTHTLGPDPWAPMADGAQCDALAAQLVRAHRAAQRYPTVAAAESAGYTLGDSYNAGLGVHYQNWNLLGPFDPDRPLELLYDGTAPDSRLVGLAYVVLSGVTTRRRASLATTTTGTVITPSARTARRTTSRPTSSAPTSARRSGATSYGTTRGCSTRGSCRAVRAIGACSRGRTPDFRTFPRA
jgi:hypothetical protein